MPHVWITALCIAAFTMLHPHSWARAQAACGQGLSQGFSVSKVVLTRRPLPILKHGITSGLGLAIVEEPPKEGRSYLFVSFIVDIGGHAELLLRREGDLSLIDAKGNVATPYIGVGAPLIGWTPLGAGSKLPANRGKVEETLLFSVRSDHAHDLRIRVCDRAVPLQEWLK